MTQVLFWIIVIAALYLLFGRSKILGFIENKTSIRIPGFIWCVGIFVLTIYLMMKLDAFNRDQNERAAVEVKAERKKNNIYYTVDGDTIAELLSVEGSASNIWTKRIYEEGDEALITALTNHLIPDNAGMTHFLFTEKFADENYYAYYNNERLTIKVSPEQMIANIKEEMKAPISGSGLNFVTIFLAKLDKFNENIAAYGNDASLKKELVRFQTKNFPQARKEYFNHVKNTLWEKNIDVKLAGKNISYTGYMFANNKVIKDTYEEIIRELEKLRFKRVSFYWAEGQDGTYWDISSKNDNEI